MERFISNIIDELTPICFKLIYTALILLIGLKLVKVFIKLIKKSKGFSKLSDSVKSFLLSFIKISLNVLVVFSAAIVLGFPAASIVTVLASAGAAIGFALQGSLSNLAGGIMLVIFKPFKVGDFIKTEGHSGTVKDISVFYTTLTTIDNNEITLPNGKVTNAVVENCSANELRRVDMTFSVSYESDIEKVKALLKTVAQSNDKVLKEPCVDVILAKQNDSSLDFYLRSWCKNEDYWAVYFTLNEQVKKEFDENNISIPFPQMDVHIAK